MALIEFSGVTKVFYVPAPQPGRLGALKALLRPRCIPRVAVDNVTFSIEEGELLGYIGPNGAGKSTTVKLLSGVLVPTRGEVRVAGMVPWKRRAHNSRRIGVVFGQRTQLWWDLPVRDSFELLRHIYDLTPQQYRRNLGELCEVLDLGPLLDTPVRLLSLGQRMRADLAAALLHGPSVLYLDEPTIGLDVVGRQRIREFVAWLNRERRATVILTTHDLRDVERLCRRVLVIDRGRIVYDGTIGRLRELYGPTRTLVVDLEEDVGDVELPGARLVRSEDRRRWFEFDRASQSASRLVASVLQRWPVRDVAIEEPDIESVVRAIYERGAQGEGA
ncbi:MAG: ATP-binding cassette domain-containing protein [Acetobacteraceae bacterium]|nr:ATP-binding cassette domain-containing protein [Acetobacteraceae bacterium]